MVILGIDPGSRRCGFGVVARRGARLTRLASGVLVPGDLPMADRLGVLLDALTRLVAARGIDAVAVETAYCGRSARSALALGQARGVALAVAGRAGLPVFEYAPAEVKRAFTGNGRAEKVQMIRTARALFGVEARLADEADALAIAVCHLARDRVPGALRLRSPRGAASGGGATLGANGGRAHARAAARLVSSVRRFAEVP